MLPLRYLAATLAKSLLTLNAMFLMRQVRKSEYLNGSSDGKVDGSEAWNS